MFWDNLINSLTRNYLNNELEVGNELLVAQYEPIARMLATESRFHRRFLSEAILQRAERARVGAISSILPSDASHVSYVLLIMQGASPDAYPAYRQRRLEDLELRCIAAKTIRPDVRFFIGLGLDRMGVANSSEDFICVDTIGWTQEHLDHGEAIRRELGYFADQMVAYRQVDDEFPLSS